MKEAYFLEFSGLSAYDGTSFHQPPLILSIFRFPVYFNIVQFLMIILDFWFAFVLYKVVKLYFQTQEAKVDTLTAPPSNFPHLVTLLLGFIFNFLLVFVFNFFAIICRYLYLPFSWLSSTAQSTAIIDNLLIIHSLYYTLNGFLFHLIFENQHDY